MTEVVVEELEFAESKNAQAGGNGGNYGGGYGNSGSYGGGSGNNSYGGNGSYGNAGGYSAPAQNTAPASDALDGFMNIPDGIDEELPFS